MGGIVFLASHHLSRLPLFSWKAISGECFVLGLWFFLNTYFMYYFSMSEKYFVVKNHNFLWINKIYKVEEIREIVFEANGKNMPNCLRIITKDFRNKLYPAGTLNIKTWLNLRDTLGFNGITVRNECIAKYLS